MEVVNWKLASHPMNWLVLFMMIFLFVLGAHFVVSFFAPATE